MYESLRSGSKKNIELTFSLSMCVWGCHSEGTLYVFLICLTLYFLGTHGFCTHISEELRRIVCVKTYSVLKSPPFYVYSWNSMSHLRVSKWLFTHKECERQRIFSY